MGYYLAIPILGIAAALQSSLLAQVRIISGQPDLVLLLVLLWAVHASPAEGYFWAVVGGLAQDLLSVLPLGSSVIALLIMVYLITNLSRQLYSVGLMLITGFVLLGTIIQIVITQIIMAWIGYGIVIGDIVQFVLAPTLVYQLILVLPVYGVVRFIQRRIYRRRLDLIR